jgi:hypothetical protein
MGIKKVHSKKAKSNFKAKPLNLAPEVLQNLIASKLQAMMAEVNPEYLKRLSTLVERELEAKKDTEDYNMDLVSEVVDKAVRVFMEGGQESIVAGDYIKVEGKIISKIENSSVEKDFNEAVKTGNYQLFPFSQSVEAELRSIFILQTNKKDTFKSLMDQMESLSAKFFPKGQFKILQEVMAKAEERIFKNPLMFPSPIQGNEQGLVRQLTEGEIKEYNLKDSLTVDERFDNHDLLALKDLVLMMQGNAVHPLAFGPSFFAKYLPELKKQGFDGVVLVVESGKLKSIKLAKLPVGNIRYSPVEAAALTFFTVQADFKEVPTSANSINKKEYEITRFEEKAFKDDLKVYVVVDGCVAIPSSKVPYDFEGAANNDARLNAGEIFVVEKIEGQFVQTRIGFVPYDYRPLHILHQHGSMILGANDQSFHSCYKETKDFAEDVINDYKKWWQQLVEEKGQSQGDAFSPAVVAARLHNFLKNAQGQPSEGAEVFKPENRKALELVMHSISEQSDFTLFWTLHTLHYYHMIYTYGIRDHISKICQNEAPLNRRWLAKTYIENGSGINIKKQETFYIKLAKDLQSAKFEQNVEMYLKLKEIDRKVSKGLSQSEAIAQVYSTEVAAEFKKLN